MTSQDSNGGWQTCMYDVSMPLSEYTVRLVATGRISMAPTIRHVLEGIDKVPEAFEITANKGKHQAINPAQVVMSG